jgi:hypothetical protein
MTEKEEKERNMEHAHEFLLWFLGKYDESPRMSLHDLMELVLARMLMKAMDNIKELHEAGISANPDENENLALSKVLSGYQTALDDFKRQFDQMMETKH